jgi:hypothetical protein
MSLEIEIDVASHVVNVTGVRDTSVMEIREAAEAVVDDPQFDRDMHVLGDFREMRWIPSTRELKDVAEFVGSIKEHYCPRTAMVVSNDLLYGVARLFSLIAKTKGYKAKPFKDLSKARAWLQRDV